MYIIFTTYLFCNLLEYILHKVSHNRHFKYLYNSHHYHHVVEFPPHKLVDNNIEYRSFIYNEYLHVSTILWIISYIYLDLYQFTEFFIESIIYLLCCDYLHSSYHRDNSYLEKCNWFKKKKKLHLLHHKKTVHNFNLFDNTSDKLLNTFKSVD